MLIPAPSLQRQKEIISVESFALQKLNKPAIIKALPNFAQAFAETIKDTFDRMGDVVQGVVHPKSFERILGKTSYAVLSEVELFKPEGMIGTYSSTLDVMEQWNKSVLDVKERLIDPLTRWLSNLLADPTKLSKLTKIDFTIVDKDVLLKSLSTVIDMEDNSTTAKYTDLVENNKEWVKVIGRVNDLNEEFAKISIKHIKKAVKNLVEVIELLIQRIEEDPETYTVSGSVMKELVETVYSVSEEVELLGIYGYRLQTLVSSIDANEERLKKIIKAA